MEKSSRSAPAGWYRDPESADLLRWWDGTSWSDDRSQPMLLPTGQTNVSAERAKKFFFGALVAVVLSLIIPFGMMLFPDPALQPLGPIMFLLGFIPGLILILLAIGWGAVGLRRAAEVHGEGRRSALTGLIGGVALLVVPGVLAALQILLASF